MKCKECGAEISLDNVLCPSCGAEIQIVPDFNIYEDEMFHTVREEELKEQEEKEKRRQKAIQEYRRHRKKKMLLIGTIVAMIAIIIGIVIGILISSRSKNDNSYEYQMQKANEAYAAKNYEDALLSLSNALSLNGDSLDARFLMCEIYLAEDDKENALKILKDILVVDSENKEAYLQMAAIYDSQGNYEAIYDMAVNTEDSSLLEALSAYLVEAPTANHLSGEYDEIIELRFIYDTDLDLYYTLDGTSPSKKNGLLYDGETITLDKNTVVRAICCDSKGNASLPFNESYIVNYEEPLEATITPDSGTYTETTLITIVAPEGSTAYYTTDGTQPTALSTEYTEPFEMPEGNHILSVLVIKGKKAGNIVTRNYIYTPMDQ